MAALPEDVWLLVFQFLSPADKLSVRSSCRVFKRLIDRPTLWRNSTVCLDKVTSYKAHFWRTLGRRKISSVVVLKPGGVRDWTELSCRLPWLVSLTIHKCQDPKALETLSRFVELKRLEIRQCHCPSLACSLSAPPKLNHFSLCEVFSAPVMDAINAVSQLTNLVSLHYHESNKPIPKTALHNLLRCLPNLKRLSLKMGENQSPLPNDYFCFPKAKQMSGEYALYTLFCFMID